MTAKNEIIVLTGKCKWANVPPRPAQKVKPEDVTNPADANNSSYSIMIECDAAQFKAFKAKKIPPGTVLHDDTNADGDVLSDTTYLRVRSSKIKGQYDFPDPVVKDAQGNDLKDNIGNGSIVKVAIEVAPNRGKGGNVLRLRGVQVLELVSWVDKDKNEDVFAALGIDLTPAQLTPETTLPTTEDIFK